MLTKDLLRVSRRGGDYHPQFVDDGARTLSTRVLGVFQGHVGERRATLDDALESLEADADDFKLVRGFAALLERDATFATVAAMPPERARRVVFETAESVGVVSAADREKAFSRAADRLHVDPVELDEVLYADRPVRQRLVEFSPRWTPDELLAQYNLSLAQAALFDATEVHIRSSDPRTVLSAVKRLRLMYQIRTTDEGRVVVVTGPDALFQRTRRYGTAFARLLRSVATAPEWTLTATIDDRGTERTLRLTQDDVSVPGVDPVTEPTYDSGIEADFAARFQGLDLDWSLVREPVALDAGEYAMIPDFAFDYAHADFRVLFEIMGFWTPAYVEKKLAQLDAVDDAELVVAVDESLSVGEAIEARDHRAVPYRGSVRVKDVVDVLRRYERDLVADAAATLPDKLVPDADVVTLADVAASHGVSEAALSNTSFPAHERIGRTLVRPSILDGLADEITPGQSFSAVESRCEATGIDDVSAVLSRLGYRVAWEGLTGGTVREK